MEHNIWNPKMECADRETIRQMQLEGLKKTVKTCYERVPLYKKKFDAIGLRPEHIKTLKDIRHIPFTTSDDLKENYPFGMFAVEKEKVIRLHGSSGTTGKPKIVGYTRNDIENWSEIVARVICAAGGTAGDITQISFGYGLFTGALGLHYGLEKLGATVIPASSGNTEKQLMMLRDFGVTGIVATPSYALYLSEMVREGEYPLSAYSKLRLGILGSEGCTQEMRETIERNLGLFISDNYGMTELGGPGVSGTCEYRNGLHFAEDAFLPEIIDPDTGEVKPAGETGELVVTTLIREGAPVLRYRTRDITRLNYEPCPCGRTTVRMDMVTGRTDDMLIIKGVNVFPVQIANVLAQYAEIGPHYQLILRRKHYLDTLEVKVELIDASLLERYGELETLTKRIHDKLKSILGLETKVTLAEPKSLERFQGKAKRILDLRNDPTA